MSAELVDIDWDCVCFSETRATAADVILDGNHRLICHKGVGYGGVAILINSSPDWNIFQKKCFGDRVLAIRLILFGRKFSVMAVYLPHAGYDVSSLNEAYESMYEATRWMTTHSHSYVIGGDFNTQLGSGWRSHRLLEFVGSFGAMLANEQSDIPMDVKYTFQSI